MGFKSANVSVNFNVMIPSKAEADIKSVSGDVSLHQIGGAARAESVSGDITAEDIKDSLRAQSVSGDLTVQKSGGNTEGKSVSGDVKILDVSGEVRFGTVSGNLSFERVKGSVEAETVSGDIKMFDILNASVVRGKSVSGDIAYKGNISKGARFDLKSHSGDISTDFDVTVSGKIRKKEIRGSVKGGGADIELKTFSGGIRVFSGQISLIK